MAEQKWVVEAFTPDDHEKFPSNTWGPYIDVDLVVKDVRNILNNPDAGIDRIRVRKIS